MKKRTLTISLIVLAIMLLVGIGYAGWVIASKTSDEAAGSFQAYEVDTANLTVTTTDSTVVFGKPASSSTALKWLDPQVPQNEDLVAAFKITWSKTVSANTSFTLTHKFYTGETEVDDLTDLQKLISGPTLTIATLPTGVTVDNASNVTTITLTPDYVAGTEIIVTVTYQWGPSLGGSSHLNPYDFFNPKAQSTPLQSGEAYSATTTNYGTLAQEALAALNTFVTTDGLNFKVLVAKAA